LRVANIALSGTVFEGLSYDGSRFVGLSDHKGAGQRPAFSIRKNHNPFQVTVHFHSETLIRFLWGCSDWPLGVLHSLHGCNITSILERFDDIQTCFDATARSFNSESDTEKATEMRELKLFVIDFLLDETILSGIDRIGPDLLSSRIRCHMWGHKVLIDIDTLEFALGLQRQVYDSGTWSSPISSAVNHRFPGHPKATSATAYSSHATLVYRNIQSRTSHSEVAPALNRVHAIHVAAESRWEISQSISRHTIPSRSTDVNDADTKIIARTTSPSTTILVGKRGCHLTCATVWTIMNELHVCQRECSVKLIWCSQTYSNPFTSMTWVLVMDGQHPYIKARIVSNR
jgi:hypothetical protein